MSRTIRPNAPLGKIEEHGRLTMKAGNLRGGKVAASTEAWLGPALAVAVPAATELRAAREAEESARTVMLEEEQKTNRTSRLVRDMMYNAHGRPRSSPHMRQVFPGGLNEYTTGNRAGRVKALLLFKERIEGAGQPWAEEDLTGWANQIGERQPAFAAAFEAHTAAVTRLDVAESAYRSAILVTHQGLQAVRRDLMNLGFTEPQIREIVPDAGPVAKTAGPEGKPTPTSPAPSNDTEPPVVPPVQKAG